MKVFKKISKIHGVFECLTDLQDADLLTGYWFVKLKRLKMGLIKRVSVVIVEEGKYVRVHRIIMARKLGRELHDHEIVDHIDGNVCNNQRDNLRLASNIQNLHNRGKRIDAQKGGKFYSQYKGVECRPLKNGDKRWRARIGALNIGTFATELEAAKAYDKKAVELYGEFAKLNVYDEDLVRIQKAR